MKKNIVKKVVTSALILTMMTGTLACGGNSNNAGGSSTGDSSVSSAAPKWDEYDSLITEIRTTTDFKNRLSLMNKAEDMLMDTWAVIPLYYYNDVYLQKAAVDGIYSTLSGMKYFMYATNSANPGKLSLNIGSEPDYLDPALNSSVDGGVLAVNSFEGLMKYNDKGEIVPAIADSYEVSEDGTTYTFKLKETKWSNGEALTANDFVYSWNRAAAEETAADYSYLFDVFAREEDGKTLSVKATDDYTLEVKLNNPCAYFMDLAAFPTFMPVYQKAVEEADPNKDQPGAWAQEAGFVSNGAFTLSSWSHDEHMTYVKNDNYYDAENVTIDQLDFMLSDEDTTIFSSYNAGDIDFADTVPNNEVAALKSNPEFHIVDNLGTYYCGFNVNSTMFNGKTVEQAADMRHAISLLIDRNYIVDAIGQTGQKAADTFVPAGMADGNGSEFKGDKSYYDVSKTGFDSVEEAKGLLEKAGYTLTDNGDGTYKCSPEISFEYLTNNSTGHIAIAEAIQSDLSVVGINVSIKTEDWNVFLEDRKAGNYSGMCREGWIADYNDPINMLEIFTSDSGNNDMQLGK